MAQGSGCKAELSIPPLWPSRARLLCGVPTAIRERASASPPGSRVAHYAPWALMVRIPSYTWTSIYLTT